MNIKPLKNMIYSVVLLSGASMVFTPNAIAVEETAIQLQSQLDQLSIEIEQNEMKAMEVRGQLAEYEELVIQKGSAIQTIDEQIAIIEEQIELLTQNASQQ